MATVLSAISFSFSFSHLNRTPCQFFPLAAVSSLQQKEFWHIHTEPHILDTSVVPLWTV